MRMDYGLELSLVRHRNPFVYLAQNDKVRLEGEKSFRKIKQSS